MTLLDDDPNDDRKPRRRPDRSIILGVFQILASLAILAWLLLSYDW